MTTPPVKIPAKKSTHWFDTLTDFPIEMIREAALPIPDTLVDAMKSKKKATSLKNAKMNPKSKKAAPVKKKSSWW